MKIDRLIGILAILLQQEKVTAPFLAEKFEVSRRTINRDIENLCKAGIPIATAQGKNGGISIMEGYRVDRTLLTSSDMRAMLTGLRSLDSVSGTNRYQQLMEKLSAGNSGILTSNDHIMIDLSSWNKPALAPRIELIQAAIEKGTRISFVYTAPGRTSSRVVEPAMLVFEWSSWYMWGYCCERKDYRLFKLRRMSELADTGESFEKKEVPAPDLTPENVFPPTMDIVALFEPGAKWRLLEEYGTESFTERPDGKLLFSCGFTDKLNLFGWLLSFGEQVELLEPWELRDELLAVVGKIGQKYFRINITEHDR